MNKKGIIIIIVGAVLILSGLFLVLYLFLFAEDPEEGFQNIRNSLPFGEREYAERESEPTEVNDEPTKPVFSDQILRKVSKHPVAENGFFTFKKDGGTYIRYISRGEGNIYEVKTDGENHTSLLSEDDYLSGVYKVSWIDENNFIILSLLEEETKVITVTLTEDEGGFTWSGGVLDDETRAYAVNSEESKYFYTLKNNTGVDGFINSFNETSGQHVFSSKIKEWLIEWPSSQKITLTTKPSGYVPGHMYTLNTQNKDLRHTLRGIYGLTTLTNKDVSYTLYNSNENGDVSLKLYDYEENKYSDALSIKTLTDKCVWKETTILICAVPDTLTSNIYPDSWYQGKISFNDSVFKEINIETDEVEDFLKPEEVLYEFEPVDAYSLKFSKLNNHFLYIDKKTGDLWVYDLE